VLPDGRLQSARAPGVIVDLKRTCAGGVRPLPPPEASPFSQAAAVKAAAVVVAHVEKPKPKPGVNEAVEEAAPAVAEAAAKADADDEATRGSRYLMLAADGRVLASAAASATGAPRALGVDVAAAVALATASALGSRGAAPAERSAHLSRLVANLMPSTAGGAPAAAKPAAAPAQRAARAAPTDRAAVRRAETSRFARHLAQAQRELNPGGEAEDAAELPVAAEPVETKDEETEWEPTWRGRADVPVGDLYAQVRRTTAAPTLQHKAEARGR
jgi:hypothetical protein